MTAAKNPRGQPTSAGGQELPPTSRFVLNADAEAKIRDAARDALNTSFARLTEERVLPRSRYRPWIWMARDYFGHAVEGSGGALAEALEAALPGRFETQSAHSIDYPWNYASALLEAAVAAATLAGEPYEVASPSVQTTIDELIEKVQAIPRSTVLRLVADVDVEHSPVSKGYHDPLGETIEVAGVRVIRVENEPEQFIERELPSAGYEVERSRVVVYPGPVSLLAATVELMADYETRVNEARRLVDHLIAAIRLATGSTARAVIDIEGDPDRVQRIRPSITPLPSSWFRFVYRPVTLAKTDVPGLLHLVSLIGSWGEQGDWMPVRIAMGRLNRSLDGQTPGIVDQVIDLAIGMEAALAGTDRTDIGLRLRTRAADILATDADPPEAIYRDVKTLYDLRSTFVHGGSLAAKKADKAIKSVTGTAETSSPAEQYLLALDRWRDVLRRAILARIALTTAAVPWTEGESRLDVDAFLLRENNRDAWREHIRAFWAARSLPDAQNRAPAASLTFGAASDASTDAGRTA
ncbi:MAG: HEPN domain-containing protein [Dehalococcoidia bacterium]|nr:HEPN domain-containing protein [Dehalococcoidia bacterium]